MWGGPWCLYQNTCKFYKYRNNSITNTENNLQRILLFKDGSWTSFIIIWIIGELACLIPEKKKTKINKQLNNWLIKYSTLKRKSSLGHTSWSTGGDPLAWICFSLFYGTDTNKKWKFGLQAKTCTCSLQPSALKNIFSSTLLIV